MLSRRGLHAPHTKPLLILVALCLAYWSKVLFTGQVLLPGAFLRGFAPFGSDPRAPWHILQWDSLAQYFPWRLFAARELHAGHIPLWNPHQFAGAPLLANGQSAVFYPLSLPFWAMDVAYAFGVSALLHTLLATLGTYFLAQRWGLSRAASMLSAIGYGFCGYLEAWAMLPTLANTASWLPLLLLLFELACQCHPHNNVGARRAILAFCVALCCALLAGHPQIFIFICFALVLRLAFLPRRGQGAIALLGGLVVTGLLSAIQTLPTLELARLGHRAGGAASAVGWEGVQLRALQWPELISLLVPNWPMVWGSVSENFGYVGAGTVFLAIAGAIGLTLRKEEGGGLPLWSSPRAFAVTLALFGLLYGLGTPLAKGLYFAVPGLSQMGGVGRGLVLWSLGAALLAGFGLDTLRRYIKTPAIAAVAILLVTGELFASGWTLHPTAPRETIYPENGLTTWLRQNANEGRVLFLTPRGRWLPHDLPGVDQPHPPGVLPPNGATVYGIDDVNGYDSLAPAAYRNFVLERELDERNKNVSPELNGNMILLNNLHSSALDALNVRYVVAQGPIDEPDYKQVAEDREWRIYERPRSQAKQVDGRDFYPGWRGTAQKRVYEPQSFRFGGFLSLYALAGMAAVVSFARRRT